MRGVRVRGLVVAAAVALAAGLFATGRLGGQTFRNRFDDREGRSATRRLPRARRQPEPRVLPGQLHRPRRARARSGLVRAALGARPDVAHRPAGRTARPRWRPSARRSGSAERSPTRTRRRSAARGSSSCSSIPTRVVTRCTDAGDFLVNTRSARTPRARPSGRSRRRESDIIEPAAFNGMLDERGRHRAVRDARPRHRRRPHLGAVDAATRTASR